MLNPAAPVPLSRYLMFFGLAIVGCGSDLWSKSVVFAWLGMPEDHRYFWLIEPYVGFQTSLNRGALFGLGQGYTPMFAVFSVIAVLGILYWLFIAKAAYDAILTTALGMITGGIFGNLYDRLGIWGEAAVRDFILFQYGPKYVWPNFNIADALLVCGAALMVWHSLFGKPGGIPSNSVSASEQSEGHR